MIERVGQVQPSGVKDGAGVIREKTVRTQPDTRRVCQGIIFCSAHLNKFRRLQAVTKPTLDSVLMRSHWFGTYSMKILQLWSWLDFDITTEQQNIEQDELWLGDVCQYGRPLKWFSVVHRQESLYLNFRGYWKAETKLVWPIVTQLCIIVG